MRTSLIVNGALVVAGVLVMSYFAWRTVRTRSFDRWNSGNLTAGIGAVVLGLRALVLPPDGADTVHEVYVAVGGLLMLAGVAIAGNAARQRRDHAR